MKNVRLTEFQRNTICNAFKEHFLNEDHLWLFGSRTDLSKKGGDIDLYIETHMPSLRCALDAKNAFFIDIIRVLGDQKIDIVINNGTQKLFIHECAKKEGVQLL